MGVLLIMSTGVDLNRVGPLAPHVGCQGYESSAGNSRRYLTQSLTTIA